MGTLEGKDLMSFAGCQQLAELIALSPFLPFDWNLISRADHIVNTNIELVGMFNDSFGFIRCIPRVIKKGWGI